MDDRAHGFVLWLELREGKPDLSRLAGRVEDVRTSTRTRFSDTRELLAFLQAQLELALRETGSKNRRGGAS